MIYYDRIGVSEGIGVNRTSESKECDICHYWYLIFNICHLVYNICHYYKIKDLSFNKCNGCHDLSMMFMNLSDIAILNIEGAGLLLYHYSEISKSEAINLMQNIDLTKKAEYSET